MGKPSAIVVLGMHRSGTSAFTRVINYLGVELGSRLLPPAADNETGVWEHRDIFEIHEKLLQSIGSSWHDVAALPHGWWRSPGVKPFRKQLLEVIERDFTGVPLWAFKDPRASRLMPLWRDIFDERQVHPGFAILLRNPLEVGGSLARRNGFPPGKSYLLWLRHMIEAERATRSGPRAIVAYEDLLADWRKEVSSVEEKLGIQWPVRPFGIGSEIELFLRPDMRHHHQDDAALAREHSLPDLVKELFSAMRNAARGVDGNLTRIAREIERHLEDADRLYSSVLPAPPEAAEPAGALELLQSRLERREQELDALRGESLFLRLQSARQEEALRDRDARLSRLHDDLSAATGRIAGLSEAYEAARRQLAHHRERASMRERRIEELSSALEARDARLSEQERRAAEQDTRIAAIAAEVDGLGRMRRGWRSRPPAGPDGAVPGGGLPGLRGMAVRACARLPRLVRHPIESWSSLSTLRNSLLFDSAFYLRSYPDVAERGVDPLWHYHRRGRFESRNPSPFFSTSYYLERNPDVAAAGVNPLAHYLRCGAREGRDPGPLFESSHYTRAYPDVVAAGLHPLEHFVRYGMYEGRIPCSPERILQLVGPYILEPSRSGCDEYLSSTGNRDRRELRVGVYSSSQGNYFYANIRDLIVEGFRRVGVDAVPLDQDQTRPEDLTHDVIVAPQEFFYLGKGREWRSHPMVDSAILVSADQLQTPWFARCLPFLTRAPMILDINFHVAAALRDLGLQAHFFPLGPLKGFSPFDEPVGFSDEPALKSLPREIRDSHPGRTEPLAHRPIDLLFVGTLNARRERFFAENAASLSRHHCFFHWVREGRPPLVEGRTAELSSRAVVGLSQRSKILLNVHRDEIGYFEWHRMVMLGIWQRALVVTERCFRIPGLVPQEHYCEAEARDIPGAIRWFLETPEGRREAEAMRARAYDSLVRRYDFERVMQSVAGLVSRLR